MPFSVIRIILSGASGDVGTKNNHNSKADEIRALIKLHANETLFILVGQMGGPTNYDEFDVTNENCFNVSSYYSIFFRANVLSIEANLNFGKRHAIQPKKGRLDKEFLKNEKHGLCAMHLTTLLGKTFSAPLVRRGSCAHTHNDESPLSRLLMSPSFLRKHPLIFSMQHWDLIF